MICALARDEMFSSYRLGRELPTRHDDMFVSPVAPSSGGTRRLPISPLIVTYLVPEAPQGRVASEYSCTALQLYGACSATAKRSKL